jgi:serine/threonine protein kinase
LERIEVSTFENDSEDIRSLPKGYKLSDYRIEGPLGHGAFGITYLATDTMLNRKVAIKEYFPREFAARDSTLLVKPAGNKEDRDNFSWGLKRFLEEARVLALFDHPNIVPVRRFFEANGTAYLVMDYCDGVPLDSMILKNGSLTKDQVEKIIYPILDGLERVHKANFLHRDIKPANIFIKSDGSPVLLDFGAARQEMLSHSRSVTSMATPGYAAFEQYSTHGKQGPWTDIYGLGATIYRAVTGDKPQDAPDRILADNLVPALERAAGKFDERFLLAIDAAIAVRPENRPQSISEWKRMLGVSQTTQQAPKIDRVEETQKISSDSQPNKRPNESDLAGKKKYPVIGGSVLAIAAVAFSAYYFSSNSDKTIATAPVATPVPLPGPVTVPAPVAIEKDKKVLPQQEEKKVEKKNGVLPACVGEPDLKTWKNCRGTFIASSGEHAGDKYVGDFDQNGNFSGSGTYTFANGNVYSGSLTAGVRSGKGSMNYSDGMKYTGDWKNNKYDGTGVLIFPNGHKYSGSFRAGMFNGKGTYNFSSGEKFVGQFVDDKRNGYGTVYFADGRKYEGNFINGYQEGFGTIYDSKGVKVYSGQWEKGAVKAENSAPKQGETTLARCNSYVVEAKKKTPVPRKIDNITTFTDMYCADTLGKPTFTYKYDIDTDLRFDQEGIEKIIREKNKKVVCGPDLKMFLPIVDFEFIYYYGSSPSNYAPSALIGRLKYSNSDCQ